MKICIIVAAALNDVIGKDNKLIWKQRADMLMFKAKTTGNTVLMGRKTFDSLGKPLPNRENVVITRNTSLEIEGIRVIHSLESFFAEKRKEEKDVYVIGGAEIYSLALPFVDEVLLTRVHCTPEGDAFFALDESGLEVVSKEDFPKDEKNQHDYTFYTYKKK